MRRLLILGMVLLGVLAVATPAQAAARMQIGEIWYNSPGSDRGGNASLRDLCKTLLLLAGGSLPGMCRKLVTRRIR